MNVPVIDQLTGKDFSGNFFEYFYEEGFVLKLGDFLVVLTSEYFRISCGACFDPDKALYEASSSQKVINDFKIQRSCI